MLFLEKKLFTFIGENVALSIPTIVRLLIRATRVV